MDTRLLRAAPRALLFTTLLLPACLLTPDGLDAERERAGAHAAPWRAPLEERELPPLADAPALEALVERAFLANGELEADWHAWRAALAAVEVESAWPEGGFEVEVDRAFGSGASGFDATKVLFEFDPVLPLPAKTEARGRIALAEARAAGERFLKRALGLRSAVLASAVRVAELATIERLRAEDAELLALQVHCCGQALTSEGAQRDFLRLTVEAGLAADLRARVQAELAAARAELDGLLARRGEPDLELDLAALPARALSEPDDVLYALAARTNPEVVELAREVEGRADALELARLAYLPDFSPRAGFVGSLEQFLGLSVMLPANLPAVRAGIARAEAELESARARVRQRHHDAAARLTADLVMLRDAERATSVLDREVVPVAERLAGSARTGYEFGSLPLRESLEARRTLLDVLRMQAQARAARETALARVEALTGLGLATRESVAPRAQVVEVERE